jgi:hypothetical protein
MIKTWENRKLILGKLKSWNLNPQRDIPFAISLWQSPRTTIPQEASSTLWTIFVSTD